MLLRLFETILKPTDAPERPEPPDTLLAFYWHFARQTKWLFAALFVTGMCVALLDTSIPFFIGRIVTMVGEIPPDRFLTDAWRWLVGMAVVIVVLRPIAVLMQALVTNQALAGPFTNLIRWQAHWHVVRQSWGFFQNDFAGRIASRVMQTGPSLRESMVSSITAIWYIVVYGTTAMGLMASADPWLALPILIWFVVYGVLLRIFVPRMRDRSRRASEARSATTGRIVDSYTNILTVKLFARSRDEDAYVRDAVDRLNERFLQQQRLTTGFAFLLSLLNACLIAGSGGLAILLWTQGQVQVGAIAMALPLTWQLTNMSRWIAFQITSIFESIGVVQEGMMTIARPLQLVDRSDAAPLVVSRGGIAFENVSFGYGRDTGVIQDLSLTVKPGEKLGVVGRSGAGKSTLVNVLLRFFDIEDGRILIDGQDISRVTQESLRSQISVVTQDTSLLHRSIRDNIRYGRPDAADSEIERAAALAHADEFIRELVDLRGRTGYDAHAGERGVKLSGGQRQRVAIARVILKDAPILVLDEATSALDSEVEAAIQSSLDMLMADKTVIAIAHRLSTIARMDRLVVMDAGRIVEEGTHAELIARDGHYARLWARQSGGFLDLSADEPRAAE